MNIILYLHSLLRYRHLLQELKEFTNADNAFLERLKKSVFCSHQGQCMTTELLECWEEECSPLSKV